MIPLDLVANRHPYYRENLNNWIKWRLTYDGGHSFIYKYLKQFSQRETNDEFRKRREITYCPAFAKAAINEIKNSIFQRMSDVTRQGGPLSYQRSIIGLDGGVDKRNSSLNAYIGLNIIVELLTMSRVGIFVDMPVLEGPTVIDKGNKHPYIYIYRTEQIRSWTYDPENPELLLAILLEEDTFDIDRDTGLTKGIITKYRHMWIDSNGKVKCQYYDSSGLLNSQEIELTIDRIPFIILELSNSLLAEVADYQIALLNLESSDLLYTLRSNFPFYTEQYDHRTNTGYIKNEVNLANMNNDAQEIRVGISAGRRYPIGAERPGFINPSSEPLKASMEKGEQIKRDIRALVNLSVQNLEPRRASATSKIADERPLENGLAQIGLELERAEQQLSVLWSLYEGSNDIAMIAYPKNYEIKTDENRKAESDNLKETVNIIPSDSFKREAIKRIAELTLSGKISFDILEKIKEEIDSSPSVNCDPEVITQDMENGLVGTELASKLRNYPPGQVEKARADHIDKITRIAMAQTPGQGYGARGVNDLSLDPKEAKQEKQTAREDGNSLVPSDNGRGEAK